MKLIIDLDERKWQSVKDGTWCGSEEIVNGAPIPEPFVSLIDKLIADTLDDTDTNIGNMEG